MRSKLELLTIVLLSLTVGYTLIAFGFSDLGTAFSTTALTGFFGLLTNNSNNKTRIGISIESLVVLFCLAATTLIICVRTEYTIQVISIATGATSGYFGISRPNSSNVNTIDDRIN